MRFIEYSCKFIALAVVFTLCLSLTVLPTTVNAHAPGSTEVPEFQLRPIVIKNNAEVLELSIEKLNQFHAEGVALSTEKNMRKKGEDEELIQKTIAENQESESAAGACGVGAFRAMILAGSTLWENGVITRSDLKIETRWTGGGAIDFCRYLTGNSDRVAVGSKGDFILKNKGKSVDTNIDYPEIRKMSREMNPSFLFFKITNKATGESIDLQIKEDVIPDGYFELREKVKFDPDKTEEESKEFALLWSQFRDNLLLMNDWEIFEGIEEPEHDTPIMALVVIFGVIALIATMWIVGKTRRF